MFLVVGSNDLQGAYHIMQLALLGKVESFFLLIIWNRGRTFSTLFFFFDGDFLTFYFAVENKCIFKYIYGNTSSVKAISPTLYIYNPYAEVTELFSHPVSKLVNCK